MINKVKDFILKNNLISKKDKIVVGVSGGPDSIALLDILYRLDYDVVVCHINHGLRENANLDEKFVKKFCKDRNLKCYTKKINLKIKKNLNGMSSEEAGRKARYDFFKEVLELENANLIATAHNENDNAETVLLNLFRGSGVSGLKGILAKNNNVIRPLIECPRKEILKYCKENDLNPCHDETNDEDIYTRNKIRLKLIPYIEKNINSNVIEAISRTSKIIEEQEDFVNIELDKAYNDIVLSSDYNCITFSLKKFNNLHAMIRKRLVLKAISAVLGTAKDIEKVHIDDIVKMCKNNVGGKYLTPNKNIKVSISNHKIHFEKI